MDGERKITENKNFEEGLRMLLQSSYNPVDSRPEFKQNLLKKLKTKQSEVIAVRAKKRKIRFAAFSFATSIAAAVALAVGVFLTSDIPADNSLEKIDIALNTSAPATTTNASLQANYHKPDLKNIDGIINISENQNTINLSTQDYQGGIELAPGVHLVMDKSSHASLHNGVLDVDKGLLSLKVKENAMPYELKLRDHRITVDPGSWLAMDIKDSSHHAPGGAPAPDLTLFSGSALVANENGQSRLSPKRTYRLHLYQALENMEGDAFGDNYGDSTLIEPTLVNFKVLKK